jgi:hypothetical protein
MNSTANAMNLWANYGGRINIGSGVIFGSAAGFGSHIAVQYNGFITAAFASYAITGGAYQHVYVDAGGKFLGLSSTITLSNTPAFSNAFLNVQSNGQAHFGAITFAGTGATGTRYKVTGSGGAINTEGGGSATYFPGNVAGSIIRNGFYDTPGTPTVASGGGTSPTITGTDQFGSITMGTATPTGVVLNWTQTHATAPICTVTWAANPLATQNFTTSTTQLTINQTATSSNVINWSCLPTGWLLNRDLDPAANDNTPMFIEMAA